MGRPRKKLDENLIEKLAGMHCTNAEIAAVCDCSSDTLERRFAAAIKRGRDKGKTSLRRAQWSSAIEKGNVTMQIWLGKQHLGQSDQAKIETVGIPQRLVIEMGDGDD